MLNELSVWENSVHLPYWCTADSPKLHKLRGENWPIQLIGTKTENIDVIGSVSERGSILLAFREPFYI